MKTSAEALPLVQVWRWRRSRFRQGSLEMVGATVLGIGAVPPPAAPAGCQSPASGTGLTPTGYVCFPQVAPRSRCTAKCGIGSAARRHVRAGATSRLGRFGLVLCRRGADGTIFSFTHTPHSLLRFLPRKLHVIQPNARATRRHTTRGAGGGGRSRP